MLDFFIANWYQIILSIVGGLATVAIIEFCKYIYKKYRHRKFKQLLGKDILRAGNFHLVYAQLALPPSYDSQGIIIKYPYKKPNRQDVSFSIDRPVSSCELRAAKYLSVVIGFETSSSPTLSSDYELKSRLDISFISLGGPFSNYKTEDVNLNEGNNLIRFDQTSQRFISVKSKQKIVDYEPGFDYGLILKIHPKQFPQRTWLICAGIGEWGTSGAAWYLANKWMTIYSFAKNRPFGCIVKVKNNQDESAELVEKIIG